MTSVFALLLIHQNGGHLIILSVPYIKYFSWVCLAMLHNPTITIEETVDVPARNDLRLSSLTQIASSTLPYLWENQTPRELFGYQWR